MPKYLDENGLGHFWGGVKDKIKSNFPIYNSNPQMGLEGFIALDGYNPAAAVMYEKNVILAIFETTDESTTDGLYKLISVGGNVSNNVIQTGTLSDVGHANSACMSDYLYVVSASDKINVYSKTTFELLESITTSISGVNQIAYDPEENVYYCCTTPIIDGKKTIGLYEIDMSTGECTLIKDNILPEIFVERNQPLRNDCFIDNGILYISLSEQGKYSYCTIFAYDIKNEKYGCISIPQKVAGCFEVREPEGMCFDSDTNTIYIVSYTRWFTAIIVSFNIYSDINNKVSVGVIPNGAGDITQIRVGPYNEDVTIYMSGNSDAPFSSLGAAIEFGLTLPSFRAVILTSDIVSDFSVLPIGDVHIALDSHKLSFPTRLELEMGSFYVNTGTFEGEINQGRGCVLRAHNVDFKGNTIRCGAHLSVFTNCSNYTVQRTGPQGLIFEA